MLEFISKILLIPWEGIKIITRVIVTGSVIVASGIYFEAPEIKINQKYIIIETQLKNSFTREIRELINSATPVILTYSISLKTEQGQIYTKEFFKEIRYDLFNKKYSLFNSWEQSEYIYQKIEQLKINFEKFKWLLCSKEFIKKYKTLMVSIQANLTIKEKIEEIKNLKLWKGEKPSISFTIEGKEISGN